MTRRDPRVDNGPLIATPPDVTLLAPDSNRFPRGENVLGQFACQGKLSVLFKIFCGQDALLLVLAQLAINVSFVLTAIFIWGRAYFNPFYSLLSLIVSLRIRNIFQILLPVFGLAIYGKVRKSGNALLPLLMLEAFLLLLLLVTFLIELLLCFLIVFSALYNSILFKYFSNPPSTDRGACLLSVLAVHGGDYSSQILQEGQRRAGLSRPAHPLPFSNPDLRQIDSQLCRPVRSTRI